MSLHYALFHAVMWITSILMIMFTLWNEMRILNLTSLQYALFRAIICTISRLFLGIFSLRNGRATSGVLTLCSDSNCNVDQIHPYLSKLLRRLFEKLNYEEQPLTGVNCGDLRLRVSEEEFREMVLSHIMLFSRMKCGLYHSSSWQHCSYIRMSGEEIREPVLSHYDIF